MPGILSLFKRKPSLPAGDALELISLHIPKTAGTSFRNTLVQVYGATSVIRLDIGLVHQETRIEEQVYTEPHLPSGVRVVHGHFHYPTLQARFPIAPEVPVITWLRDPVERVVSNYFYLARRLREELQEEARGLNILSKMQRSLLEYAQQDQAQNRMSKFLAGRPLESFHFVGLVAHYEEDLQALARRLAWPTVPVFHYNETGAEKKPVDPHILEMIREWNQEDIRLYERARTLRESGYWQA